MRGHALTVIDERVRAFQELRQEIQGRAPKGPFEFAADLDFKDLAPEDSDPPVVKRFKRAMVRDLKYSAAGAVFMLNFGLSQNLRSIYDGGRQLIDGGAE
jgi:hypothetical protein